MTSTRIPRLAILALAVSSISTAHAEPSIVLGDRITLPQIDPPPAELEAVRQALAEPLAPFGSDAEAYARDHLTPWTDRRVRLVHALEARLHSASPAERLEAATLLLAVSSETARLLAELQFPADVRNRPELENRMRDRMIAPVTTELLGPSERARLVCRQEAPTDSGLEVWQQHCFAFAAAADAVFASRVASTVDVELEQAGRPAPAAPTGPAWPAACRLGATSPASAAEGAQATSARSRSRWSTLTLPRALDPEALHRVGAALTSALPALDSCRDVGTPAPSIVLRLRLMADGSIAEVVAPDSPDTLRTECIRGAIGARGGTTTSEATATLWFGPGDSGASVQTTLSSTTPSFAAVDDPFLRDTFASCGVGDDVVTTRRLRVLIDASGRATRIRLDGGRVPRRTRRCVERAFEARRFSPTQALDATVCVRPVRYPAQASSRGD